MPRLPDLEVLGPRPTLNPGRPISSIDMGGMGRAMQGAAAEIGEMAKKMELEDDNTAISAARRALNDWERDTIYDPEKGAANRRGVNAFGVGKEVAASFDEFSAKVAEGLRGGRQKQLFSEIANSRRAQVLEWADKHVLREREVHQIGEFEASQKSYIERAALKAATATTPQQMGEVAAEIKLMQSQLIDFYRSKGIGNEKRDFDMARVTSDAHAGVLRTLITSGRTKEADAYYNANLKQIDEKDRAALAGEIRKRADAIEAVSFVDQIWGSPGPNDPILIADKEKAARAKYADQPEKLAAVINQLHQREAAHNRQQNEVNTANVNSVIGAYRNGASLLQLQQQPEFNALPETKRREIENMVKHDLDVARAKSEADAARLTRVRMEQALPKFWYYSNPDLLSKMSSKDVESLLPSLGPELTGRLLAQRQKMDDPVKLAEARIDTDLFNSIAHRAGLRPYDTSLSEEQRGELGGLKDAVEQAIDAAQKGAKRDMDRTEKGKLMQQIVDDKLFIRRPMRFSDKEIIGRMATSEELAKAYVLVDGKEVSLGLIPEPVKEQIMLDLARSGKPVTWRNVAEGWVRKGKPTR